METDSVCGSGDTGSFHNRDEESDHVDASILNVDDTNKDEGDHVAAHNHVSPLKVNTTYVLSFFHYR